MNEKKGVFYLISSGEEGKKGLKDMRSSGKGFFRGKKEQVSRISSAQKKYVLISLGRRKPD